MVDPSIDPNKKNQNTYHLGVELQGPERSLVDIYTNRSVHDLNVETAQRPAGFIVSTWLDTLYLTPKTSMYGKGVCLLPQGQTYTLKGVCHTHQVNGVFDEIDSEYFIYGTAGGLPHFR